MKEFISKHPTLIFSAVIVPTLYAVGYSYELGYASQYHLNMAPFKESIEYYLMHAFYSFMRVATFIYSYFNKHWEIICLFGFLISLIMYIILWCDEYKATEKFLTTSDKIISWIRSLHGNCKFLVISVITGITSSALLYVLPSLLLIPILLPWLSYQQGKHDAETRIANYQPCDKNDPTLKNCVYITQDGKLIDSGQLVAISEMYVAIFDGTQTRVLSIGSKEIVIVVK